MNSTIEKLQNLQEEAFKTNDFKSLTDFFQTEEYKNLPYIVRNKGFITSHKMLDFMKCQWCYAQKYINEIPDPTEGDSEALFIGQAFDDRITEGEEYFKSKYKVVARRSKNSQEKQLTNGMSETLESLKKEFFQNKLFNPSPRKKIVFSKLGGFILKAELDDINLELHKMADLKTTANITTFDPHNYLHQMSFYQLVVEEAQGIRCSADLEVVDKYGPFSRSGLFHFSEGTLFSNRGALIQTLEKMRLAYDSGIFEPAKDQNILYGCSYYGLKTSSSPDGHGRPTKPVIF